MIELAFKISLITIGFRCITDKGMILYFLRSPFDKLVDRKTGYISTQEYKKAWKYDWLIYLAKPFITCSTCMASVHTLLWYPYFIGWDLNIIPTMLMVATMNTVIFAVIELVKKNI